jgi:hypothetical protein
LLNHLDAQTKGAGRRSADALKLKTVAAYMMMMMMGEARGAFT